VYSHDEPGGVAAQPLLPPEVQDERFYEPTDRGFEAELAERLERLRRLRAGDS
jgi:putative ATPase